MRLASIVTALCSSVKLGRSTAIAPIVWYPRRCHPFTNSCLVCWVHLALFQWETSYFSIFRRKTFSLLLALTVMPKDNGGRKKSVFIWNTPLQNDKVLRQKVPHPAATPLGTTPRGSQTRVQFLYSILHSAKLDTVYMLRREHQISISFEFPCFCQPHYYSLDVIKMLLFVC